MSNLGIINDWLNDRNHRPTNVGYSNIEKIQEERERKVGDRWEDADGKLWEKTSYGKKSIPKVLTALKESNPTCICCGKEIQYTNHHDVTSYRIEKNCFDCQIELDTKRKLNGTFDKHQSLFVLRKQRDYIVDTLTYLNEIKEQAQKDSLDFVNEDGTLERWGNIDSSKILDDIQKEINEGTEKLEEVTGELEKLENELNG